MAELGFIRKIFFPIYNHELKKFLLLSLLFFCLVCTYPLLRDISDTLIINSVGPIAMSWLNFYCILPATFIFIIIYMKLCNILSREHIFYAIMIPFLAFFLIFVIVIYPNMSILTPSQAWIKQAIIIYPALNNAISIAGYWPYALFYVIAKIWGHVIISFMFWQFMNQVVSINEAKRFYLLFLLAGNLALVFSWQCIMFCEMGIKQYFSGDTWQISLSLMMSIVVVMGIVAMLLYRWIHVAVLTNYCHLETTQNNPKEPNCKLNLIESFKLIFSSKELWLIVLLLITSTISINLIAVQWKAQLGIYYAGDKGAYNAFMGNYRSLSAIAGILFMFVGCNIMRTFTWFKSAIVPPIIILIAGSIFFFFILLINLGILPEFGTKILTFMHVTPNGVIVFLGTGMMLLSHTITASMCSSTKEIIYIPLDVELKTKGKAVVDIVGNSIGKSSGPFIQSVLLLIFSTNNVIDVAPISFGIFFIMILLWILSLKILANRNPVLQ